MQTLRMFIMLAALLFSLTGCARVRLADTNGVSPTTPSHVTPTAPSMTEAELQYTFDPYVLPSDAMAYLGDALPDYRCLVDAVLARQTTVSLPKASLSKAVDCLICEFPLCALISDFNIDCENNSILFDYLYNEEAHAAHIKAFEARVAQAIRTSVLPSYNDFEKALVLYRWTAQNISYIDGNDVSVYHALIGGEGICQSYAGVYQFLLLLVDMDAFNASGFMNNDEAHEWTVIPLDGCCFHMDPTFENSCDGGNGLEYFGMSDATRELSGAESPFTTGIGQWCATAPICDDTRFDSFANCGYWELDADTHQLLLYDISETEPYAVFDTVTYETSFNIS